MDEERKITRDKARPNRKRKIKMNNQMKKRLIITVSILLLLLVAIIIVVSRVTNQTSANVGKQDTNNSQTDENDKKPEETENPGDTQQPNDNPTEEKPTEQQPQNPNQATETKDPQEGKTGKEKYYIKVNNQANVVTVYKKDSNGYYTVPYKAMVCSIGTATPESGVYNTKNKYTWRKLYGHTEGTYVWGQYATRIVNSILFHSVPYQNENDPSSLEYWEYDKLGTKASAGCVRLTVEDAKWIYDNCAIGTQVEFYSSADPGPLGKPTAQKISNESAEVRGWDPTDPSGSNPWKTYKKNQQSQQQTVENSNTNQNNNNQTVNPTNPNEGGGTVVQQPEKPTVPSGGEQQTDNKDNTPQTSTNPSEGTPGEGGDSKDDSPTTE